MRTIFLKISSTTSSLVPSTGYLLFKASHANLMSVFILHNYCSSTGTCQPYKSCYIIFMYHSMRFYMVYSHWLWQLPQTALYLDIIINGYYVMHICNLEQFENKVTYLLTFWGNICTLGFKVKGD